MRIFSQDQASVKIGQRFGRWEVAGPEFSIPIPNAAKANGWQRKRFVVVRCDCGAWGCAIVACLKNGTAPSCGCRRSELLAKLKTRHGQCDHPLYGVWSSLRKRCENPACASYANYGGRGIRVCEEWQDFAIFFEWAIGAGWQFGLEIDRIDNDGNYEPGNCRFVTTTANQRNKRDNHLVTAFGETKILIEWSEDPRCAIGYCTLVNRLRAGWPPEQAIALPPKPSRLGCPNRSREH